MGFYFFLLQSFSILPMHLLHHLVLHRSNKILLFSHQIFAMVNHIAESSFYKNKAKLTGGSSKSDRNMHSHFIPAVLTDKMLYYDYSGFWLITRKLKKDAFM